MFTLYLSYHTCLEAANIIVDETKTLDERLGAFELLQDLVENVDNAKSWSFF